MRTGQQSAHSKSIGILYSKNEVMKLESLTMKQWIASYEESLAMIVQRIAELRDAKKQPDISPKVRDDLDIRLKELREERKELKRDISDMSSYLRAWGESV